MNDLLGIASSGVLAQQRMLQTTSNNITNVNSEGYVRERTLLYSNDSGLGVGQNITERIINQYALGEMRRDTSAQASASTRYNLLYQTDALLSDEANSVGSTITSYFNALHTANESPDDLYRRTSTLNELDNMVNRFHSLAARLDEQTGSINSQLENGVDKVNGLLQSINDLNEAIVRTHGSEDASLTLYDQRDESIRQLAEMMDIRTLEQENGCTLVNLANGQSLVLAGAKAELAVVPGDPQGQLTQVQWQLGSSTNTVDSRQMGGSLGGLISAREALEPLKRELGQLSVAIADGLNEQNHLGMDMDNEIGGDLFSLPTSQALTFETNTGSAKGSVAFVPGEGADVTAFDYEMRFDGAGGYELFSRDASGKASSLGTGSLPPATFKVEGHGIEISVSGTPNAGDKLLFQPTRGAASALATQVTRGEDLALASPLKAQKNAQNLGNGEIKLDGIYSTGAALSGNGLASSAPQRVSIADNGDYQVYDGNNTLLGTAPAASKGQQLLASLKDSSGTFVYADPAKTPGYEISITGSVKANDSFTLAYNTDGFADNSNGLQLAELQNQDMVRKGSGSSHDKITFNEAYSALIVEHGNKTSQAKSAMTAADAKLQQSQSALESVTGVNLDEEAANLIRYQQSYAASAQVLSVAKTIFDTLLSSVR